MTVPAEKINAIREDAKTMSPRELCEKYHYQKSTMHNLCRRENIKCSVRSKYRVSDKVIKARSKRKYRPTKLDQNRKEIDDDKQIKRLASGENIAMLLRINKDNIICKSWV